MEYSPYLTVTLIVLGFIALFCAAIYLYVHFKYKD